MKTLKLGLAAVLLTLAVGASAFKNVHAAPKVQDQLYDWTHFDRDGNVISGDGENASVTDAQSDYGCSGNGVKCATGTATGQQPVTIKYND